MRKPSSWFPSRLDILNLEELYFLSSENKGADQLRAYFHANVRISRKEQTLFTIFSEENIF